GILMGEHFVYSCTQPSTSAGTRKVLESLNKNDLTLVISGTHGDKTGSTGASDSSLLEADFFMEDMETIKSLGRTQTTTLVAAQHLSESDIENARTTGKFGGVQYVNVVLAYCYGRRAMF
ncbi:hypothetical protein VU11_07120, partial [Desulfobulbus sp. US2]|nr:hypothetical protein [Desulfobulbus sp. US2]